MPDSTEKPYYDHDFLWEKRKALRHPVWGSNSHRVYLEVIDLLAAQELPVKSILDVGCGAGAFGPVAAAHGYDYVGVDASAVAIELGRSSFPDTKLFVADFVHPDFVNSRSQSYSIVTCINVLHCLVGDEERIQLLANLLKVAANDARLVLTTMVGPVSEDVVEKRLPRAYKMVADIVAEVDASGWKELEVVRHSLANERAKIGNITLLARKTL
jgi:2-polyprenyl-3-methyl-5-hydroxy-6-metoxy-1,4-benzoquinol methylase